MASFVVRFIALLLQQNKKNYCYILLLHGSLMFFKKKMTRRDLFLLGVPVYIDKQNDFMTRVYNTSNLLYYTCEEAAKAKFKAYSNINNGLKIGIGFESHKKNINDTRAKLSNISKLILKFKKTLTRFRFKRREIGKKDTLIIPRIVIINARGILKNSAHRLTQYENLITMIDDIALIMITDLHQ
ncbi:uncharacterized protein EV154DRAFT_487178 [Mucor mucedo]|uniref:uncharacterized protein n=1 Tax=Mucor mucedo TaxID=29922 RepID=UPI00221F390C|nr:uncharacterized protein EV154DRAFT_487178 [Mucor mucedo]KAI7873488.1 hypothetical protein EV154DRAFT_487178 [Mucor mucedo]